MVPNVSTRTTDVRVQLNVLFGAGSKRGRLHGRLFSFHDSYPFAFATLIIFSMSQGVRRELVSLSVPRAFLDHLFQVPAHSH